MVKITVTVHLPANFEKGTYSILEDGVIKATSVEYIKATANTLNFIGLVRALGEEKKSGRRASVQTNSELMRYLINDNKSFKIEDFYDEQLKKSLRKCNLWLLDNKSGSTVDFIKPVVTKKVKEEVVITKKDTDETISFDELEKISKQQSVELKDSDEDNFTERRDWFNRD